MGWQISNRAVKHQKIIRWLSFSAALLFTVAMFVFMFLEMLEVMLICFGCFFAPFFIFLISFRPAYVKESEEVMSQIKAAIINDALSLNEVTAVYRHKDLNDFDKPILTLLYNKDGTQRIFMVQESNAVKVHHQQLVFLDDREKLYNLKLARWESVALSDSYYADVDIATRENAALLKDFTHAPLDFHKEKSFQAEVKWLHHTISSHIIPFGQAGTFDIVVGGNTVKDVKITNNYWFYVDYGRVTVFYPTDRQLDFKKPFNFTILHNNVLIGKGRFYKNSI